MAKKNKTRQEKSAKSQNISKTKNRTKVENIRIAQIQFYDYGAFYDGKNEQYTIKTEGKNCLIYGENGSGKTSIFKGLRDFFKSSTETVDFNKHNQSTDLGAGFIKVIFEHGTEQEFKEDGTIPTETFIADSDKIKGFLSYKELLKTYLTEKEDDEINLFELLVENILKDHELDDKVKLGDAWRDLKTKNLEQDLKVIEDAFTKGEISEEEAKEQKEITEEKYKNEVKKFEEKLQDFLKIVDSDINKILAYFNQNVEVTLELDTLDFTNLSKTIIKPRVNYFGNSTPNYLQILNEARLSALAISIYLASIKSNPTQASYKILFLDDIFIGLDMSNRIPLLEILKIEFSDWQIFMTTYDRYWFEVAKDWFAAKVPNQWKLFEMYANDYDNPNFEIPKIIPTETPLSRATYYYKQSDYPASANYLRRACEQTIQSILPKLFLKGGDGLDLEGLDRLLTSAITFFTITGEPLRDLENLKVYLQALMNPLSHYDIAVSAYRTEIKDVEKAIQNLQMLDFRKTKLRKILDKGKMVKLSYQVAPTVSNVYELKLESDLWIYQFNGQTNIVLGNAKCKNENLYEVNNGVQGKVYHHQIRADSLQKFYENALNEENRRNSILNLSIQTNYEDLYEYQDDSETWQPIRSLMNL